MPSTVIRSFEYRPGLRELEVTFTTGRRYIYSDVPPDIAETLRASRTKGIYFNKSIRPNYRYREISPTGA
jgi:hypothetical protein